jgi:hypothetical protein
VPVHAVDARGAAAERRQQDHVTSPAHKNFAGSSQVRPYRSGQGQRRDSWLESTEELEETKGGAMPKALLGLGVVVALAITTGACGQENVADPGVATARTPEPASKTQGTSGRGASKEATTPTPAKPTTLAEAKLIWVKCMRAQGLEMPDPLPDGTVVLPLKQKAEPKFPRGVEKCRSKEPPEELYPEPDKLPRAELAKARRYAVCMRREGVPEFPDPGPYGFGEDSEFDSLDQNLPRVRRAFEVCLPIVDGDFDPDKARG